MRRKKKLMWCWKSSNFENCNRHRSCYSRVVGWVVVSEGVGELVFVVCAVGLVGHFEMNFVERVVVEKMIFVVLDVRL